MLPACSRSEAARTRFCICGEVGLIPARLVPLSILMKIEAGEPAREKCF